MSNYQTPLESASSPQIENTMGDYNSSWVTDYAWISGVAGAVMTLAIAAWYKAESVLQGGLIVFGHKLTETRDDSIIAALLMITFCMLLVEGVRLWMRDPSNFFNIHPKIKSGNYLVFVLECAAYYFLSLAVLATIIFLYQIINEYGFQINAAYYQVWFGIIDKLWDVWLIAGLIYIPLTRALKYDEESDKRDYGFYLLRLALWPVSKILGSIEEKYRLSLIDKKITLGLFVKMFFTPLMTIFFINQFPHLVNNMGYLFGDIFGQAGLWSAVGSGNYSNSRLNNDLFNVSISIIFAIDVALAWCGYVVASRWVDNQTVSAEPTILGWVVCLLCYPPTQVVPGWLFSPPGEKEAIYMFDSQWVITIFLIMMVASYIVYMSATLWFGTRFSNLTHRGIIRKGPFAIIRHPAYASKNFAWWCIMFPAIIYNATVNSHFIPALTAFLGLILMTFMYYWRAISEERHLSADPAYHEYCKHVKYRFIPGVI